MMRTLHIPQNIYDTLAEAVAGWSRRLRRLEREGPTTRVSQGFRAERPRGVGGPASGRRCDAEPESCAFGEAVRSGVGELMLEVRLLGVDAAFFGEVDVLLLSVGAARLRGAAGCGATGKERARVSD